METANIVAEETREGFRIKSVCCVTKTFTYMHMYVIIFIMQFK